VQKKTIDANQISIAGALILDNLNNEGRIVIDVTDFVDYMVNSFAVSGIQRVISAISDQFHDPARVVFCVWTKGNFRSIPYHSNSKPIKAINAHINRRRSWKFFNLSHFRQKDRLQAAILLLKDWRFYSLPLINFNPNDKLLIIGAAWNNKAFLKDVSRIKSKKRVKIDVFIHDTIPIFGEEFVSHGAFHNFREYLKWIDDWADQIYCNSNYSKSDLIRTGIVAKANDATVIPLAHEFTSLSAEADERSIAQVNSFLKNQFDRWQTNEFALCVGTIERRKNQIRLAQAWSELALERKMPLLVLAGKLGHNSDPLKILIDREHPPISILEKTDDTMLAQLYQKCQFTIFPSLFEGWGLPVGESLWFGKPCLASNASSIPEVGGKYATYFNPQSIEDIKDNIRAFLDKAEKHTPPDRIALRTWRKVNDELMACLTTPLQIFAHTDTEAQ
jgi:glycosyltransferase involved in cell wall biosynthesis